MGSNDGVMRNPSLRSSHKKLHEKQAVVYERAERGQTLAGKAWRPRQLQQASSGMC